MTTKSNAKPVLIIGGGLAGLSAAFHLKKTKNVLIERETTPGGTARSFRIKGFTFDFTGHLLHLHTPYTKKLITRLLNNNFFSCVRSAWIYSHNTYTPYPFQANTHGLPDRVVKECVLGFIEAQSKPKKKISDYSKKDFKSWCLETFGTGISKHFMIPYNEKLYQVPAAKMSTDWCGPFVPTPKLGDVVKGALAQQDKRFGYNTTFLYPKKGGIEELAKAFARRLPGVHLGTGLAQLDWKKKEATLSTGEKINYRNAISTIPLPELLKRMPSLPTPVKNAHKKLKGVSILCLNLGVRRAKISDTSWIYFPEKKYPFYRVGFPMNFTPHVVPKGCSSMYVEVPFDVNKPYNKKKILSDVRAGLIESGILKRSDKIVVAQFLPIRYAYVIYNAERPGALNTIFSFLKKHGIQSIGRYGAWKYSFMEEAILDGKKAAEAL
jgi:protoporphyrinogen oxidase